MKMISRRDLWQCGGMFCRRKEVCVCIDCYQLFPPSFFPAFVSPLVAAGRLTSLLRGKCLVPVLLLNMPYFFKMTIHSIKMFK